MLCSDTIDYSKPHRYLIVCRGQPIPTTYNLQLTIKFSIFHFKLLLLFNYPAELIFRFRPQQLVITTMAQTSLLCGWGLLSVHAIEITELDYKTMEMTYLLIL